MLATAMLVILGIWLGLNCILFGAMFFRRAGDSTKADIKRLRLVS
jgi:hypothetical protein